MYRTGELSKQNYSSSATNEKLRQKKRLSFREPEVEASHNSSCSNSNRIQSKHSALLALNADGPKQSTSLEDLTLEDQTFIIAKHVGQAFDKKPCDRRGLNTGTSSKTSCFDSMPVRRNGAFLNETLQNDCSHIGSGLQKNGSNSRISFSSEDAQCFEALSPPVLNMSTMKFPAIEAIQVNESNLPKTNQALVVASTDKVSTSVQHQLQLLTYQLEHQRQQTQMAFAQIQLLKDQLQAETTARFKAQTQNHQLIMQNKELLDHIQKLFQQIQDLEKKIEKHERKPTFPTTSSSQDSQETRITEASTTNSMTTQKNNGEGQPTKSSTFPPNTVMANRRSSLTSFKPFHPKTNYFEANSKRDEVRLNTRGSSPASQIRSPQTTDFVAHTTNSSPHERSNLFHNAEKNNGLKDISAKERPDSSTNERSYAKKPTEDLQVSSIPISNLTAKNATKSNLKPLMNSESNFRDENLILNENPFLIQEKSPRKVEGYSSRKNHSSDPPPEYAGTKISSLALTPKSYGGGWSKSSKFQNNDSVLPLALDSTTNFSVKENKWSTSGNSKLFNS